MKKLEGPGFLKTKKEVCANALPIFVFTILIAVFQTGYSQKSTVETEAGAVKVETLADKLNHPWGMAFLPNGKLLVTERAGTLRILDENNKLSAPLQGTPKVFAQGQGGVLDVALHPNFEQNNMVYISFAEPGNDGTASTALGRGKLENNRINNFEVIFTQEPKIEGPNHFGGRIVFSSDNTLFLTMGERFQFEPAQDLGNHLGTIVRINDDGSIPKDNPFVGKVNAEDAIWSYGHRNIEAAAINPQTNDLWIAEMGPLGGDEFNQPQKGKNYGWPVVSWGQNYDGSDIPDPNTRPEFADAAIHWTPTISPSGLLFYSGKMFPQWKGSALIGGLTSTGLVRVNVKGDKAEEVERIPLTKRIRDVEEAADGSIYVLTDESNGKILKLTRLE